METVGEKVTVLKFKGTQDFVKGFKAGYGAMNDLDTEYVQGYADSHKNASDVRIEKLEKLNTHLFEQIGWIRGSIEGMDERLSDLDIRLEKVEK